MVADLLYKLVHAVGYPISWRYMRFKNLTYYPITKIKYTDKKLGKLHSTPSHVRKVTVSMIKYLPQNLSVS